MMEYLGFFPTVLRALFTSAVNAGFLLAATRAGSTASVQRARKAAERRAAIVDLARLH